MKYGYIDKSAGSYAAKQILYITLALYPIVNENRLYIEDKLYIRYRRVFNKDYI